MFRSSHPEVFCKKGALENFAKLTGKHLCDFSRGVARTQAGRYVYLSVLLHSLPKFSEQLFCSLTVETGVNFASMTDFLPVYSNPVKLQQMSHNINCLTVVSLTYKFVKFLDNTMVAGEMAA